MDISNSTTPSSSYASISDYFDSNLPQNHNSNAGFVSFVVILISEIGDKTFLIAAIMAMTNPRLLIFSAAISALSVMTLLSALLGHVVPTLLSKKYTQLIVSILFVIFGIKMLLEALDMKGDEISEEMEQVQSELMAKDKTDEVSEVLYDEMESGEVKPTNEPLKKRKQNSGWMNLLNLFFSPIFIQTFILTFLAEWGDRSQIATIALAGTGGFWFVTIGGILGHSVCTSVAVIGGRMLASKISIKTVTYLGAALFFIFGVHSLYESYKED